MRQIYEAFGRESEISQGKAIRENDLDSENDQEVRERRRLADK
tara:strand:+ start:288 stop:416 length:129 start_codon:yes stop_codon:yes gene_type:complete